MSELEKCIDDDSAIKHCKKLFKKHRDLEVEMIQCYLTNFSGKSPKLLEVWNEGTVKRNKLKVIKFDDQGDE
jgi:hypothetical protein